MIECGEARERFFKALNDHPENIELIAHNAGAVMLKGIKWPEGFSEDQISRAIEVFFLEFWRRWEWARRKKERA